MAALESFVELGPDGFPIFNRLPTVDGIAAIVPTSKEGMATLHRYQALLGHESPETIRLAQVKYLERFNITPTNPLYKQQLANLANEANANKVLVATSRRITEQAQTMEMVNGDTSQEMIRIAEGPDPCENCISLNGETGTYKYFVDNNMRPGDQCVGGGNCLCQLIPYE